jgi:FG-GAP repeat
MQLQPMRIVSLLLLAGCNPGSFDEYLDTAPIRVGAAPDKFNGPSYGHTMVTLRGQLDGKPVSRVVAAGTFASRDTRLVFTRAYDDGKISESTFLRCAGTLDCKDTSDIGTTLIPFESWGLNSGGQGERHICVYAPANATQPAIQGSAALGGNGYVACENTNSIQHFTLGPAITDVRGDGGTLVFSGFGLPPEHPLGVVMLGVYSVNSRNSAEARSGGLYLQADNVFSEQQSMVVVPFLTPVQLEDPATGEPFSAAPDAADLGAQVAGAVRSGKDLVFAVSQPSKQRVLVASYDDSLPGEPLEKVRLHACIESPDASLRGFGERVLVGDLTGDGAPEIVIGTNPVDGVEPGKQGLFVYDGRSLPRAVDGKVCPPWDAEAAPVVCRDEEGLRCDGSGFGGSLALGDVDADGKNDLIVGAPNTTVGGKAQVGAVWILPGGAQGLDVQRSIAITVPSQAKAQFGWNVAALHTKDRDEPVASAPGVSEIYTIMCTPLERGFGGDELCLE